MLREALYFDHSRLTDGLYTVAGSARPAPLGGWPEARRDPAPFPTSLFIPPRGPRGRRQRGWPAVGTLLPPDHRHDLPEPRGHGDHLARGRVQAGVERRARGHRRALLAHDLVGEAEARPPALASSTFSVVTSDGGVPAATACTFASRVRLRITEMSAPLMPPITGSTLS